MARQSRPHQEKERSKMVEKKKKEGTKKKEKNSTLFSSLSTKDLDSIHRMLDEIENNLQNVKHLLFTQNYKKQAQEVSFSGKKGGTIIEGIFDGEEMISRDGNKYPVPVNYASKSKLVSGDVLKLTIVPDGTFIFKQIGPVERKKMIGELKESNGRYFVISEGKKYKVLLASVTYFKAQVGDKITIIVPKEGESEWAAIENIIGSEKKE